MGYLGGVEEAGSVCALDCADEHRVGYAGDEVTNVLSAGERGHRSSVCPLGDAIGSAVAMAAFKGGLAGLTIGLEAAFDCGVGGQGFWLGWGWLD